MNTMIDVDKKIDFEEFNEYLRNIAKSLFLVDINNTSYDRDKFYPRKVKGLGTKFVKAILPESAIDRIGEDKKYLKKYTEIYRSDYFLLVPTDISELHNDEWKGLTKFLEAEKFTYSSVLYRKSRKGFQSNELHAAKWYTAVFVNKTFPGLNNTTIVYRYNFGRFEVKHSDFYRVDSSPNWKKHLIGGLRRQEIEVVDGLIMNRISSLLSNAFNKELEILNRLYKDNYLRTLGHLSEVVPGTMDSIGLYYKGYSRVRLKLLINLLYNFYFEGGNVNSTLDLFKRD